MLLLLLLHRSEHLLGQLLMLWLLADKRGSRHASIESRAVDGCIICDVSLHRMRAAHRAVGVGTWLCNEQGAC